MQRPNQRPNKGGGGGGTEEDTCKPLAANASCTCLDWEVCSEPLSSGVRSPVAPDSSARLDHDTFLVMLAMAAPPHPVPVGPLCAGVTSLMSASSSSSSSSSSSAVVILLQLIAVTPATRDALYGERGGDRIKCEGPLDCGTCSFCFVALLKPKEVCRSTACVKVIIIIQILIIITIIIIKINYGGRLNALQIEKTHANKKTNNNFIKFGKFYLAKKQS